MFRPLPLDAASTGTMRSRTFLSTVGVGVQGSLRFLSSVLVGRIGGPAVLGVVNSAISTAMFLSLLWPTSAGSAASKFVARARGAQRWDEAAAVARHLGGRTFAAALVLAAVGVGAWTTVGGGDLEGGLCVAALVLGYSGYSFVRGLQFGAGQVARATGWDVLSASLGLAGLLIALAAGARGTGLLLPLAAGYAVYTVAGWPRGSHGRPEAALRRELDLFVLLGVTGTIASTGFLQLSMVVARAADTAEQAGQYASALALATPASLLAGSLSLVLFPAMAETWGRGDHVVFRRQTDHAMRLMVLIMVGIFGSLILCSRLLVDVVFGARFAEAQQLLPVLLLAVLATSLGVVSSNSLTTRSQRGMVITSAASLSGLLTGLVLWAVIAPQHGVMGVAVGYLCGTTLITAIPLVVVWRRDNQHWRALMARLGVGLGAALLLLLTQHRLDVDPWLDPAFALVFLACWMLLSWRDVRDLLRPLLLRRAR